MNFTSKPLNILVYTGEDPMRGKCYRYENIASNLQSCVHRNCYLLYLLKPSQIFRDPWQENLKLLVISCETVHADIATEFAKYISSGGRAFISCSHLKLPSLDVISSEHAPKEVVKVHCKEYKGVPLMRSNARYSVSTANEVLCCDDLKRNVIFKLDDGKKCVVFSEVHLELDPVVLDCSSDDFAVLSQYNSERLSILRAILSSEFCIQYSEPCIPKLTPCFLFSSASSNNVEEIMKSLESKKTFKRGLNLKLVNFSITGTLPEATEEELPIVYKFHNAVFNVPFNRDIYFTCLQTLTFGHHLFFVEVVSSTMDVIYNLADVPGCCVVASQQTVGKGRGGNKWLSPVGSASFSTTFSLPLSSALGQKLSLIQHFAALSIVLAVRETTGYENLDLRLKWPNDIYYGREIKLGGILVNSSIQNDTVHVFIGCGFNVSNSHPTLCLNDIIQFHNSSRGLNLSPFSIEQLIACSLLKLEVLINSFQANGPESFFTAYYTYWLHQDQKVTLVDKGIVVRITGLDDYGFLKVEDEKGCSFSLQPDGNSFNMMKNLITVK